MVYHINQGILYIQNVRQCHGTHVNVVSLMLIRKVQPSLCHLFIKLLYAKQCICASLMQKFRHTGQ